MSEMLASDCHDEYFMNAALEQARLALYEGEVPVGCVIVRDGDIIARGRNNTNETRNGTRHAELVAIDQAFHDWKGDVGLANFSCCDLIIPVHELGCGDCGTDKGWLRSKGTYPSRGGIFAKQAVELLQDFYIAGNPNAPKPHRPVRERLESR